MGVLGTVVIFFRGVECPGVRQQVLLMVAWGVLMQGTRTSIVLPEPQGLMGRILWKGYLAAPALIG